MCHFYVCLVSTMNMSLNKSKYFHSNPLKHKTSTSQDLPVCCEEQKQRKCNFLLFKFIIYFDQLDCHFNCNSINFKGYSENWYCYAYWLWNKSFYIFLVLLQVEYRFDWIPIQTWQMCVKMCENAKPPFTAVDIALSIFWCLFHNISHWFFDIVFVGLQHLPMLSR